MNRIKRLVSTFKVFFMTNDEIIELIRFRSALIEKHVIRIQNNSENKIEELVSLIQIVVYLKEDDLFSAMLAKLKKKNQAGQFDHIIIAAKVLERYFTGYQLMISQKRKARQRITPNLVHLGNIYKIPLNSAAYWLRHRERLEKEFMEKLFSIFPCPSVWYCVNNYQAGNMVESFYEDFSHYVKIIQKTD